MSIRDVVDQKVKAVCPIHGISFGSPRDKATWRVDFKDEATDEQKAAAKSLIEAFDFAAAADILEKLAEIDRATGSVRWVRELALGTNDIIEALRGGPLPNLPSAGTGMAKVQAVEDMAAALRKQLASIG